MEAVTSVRNTSCVAFRLSTELLARVDTLCREMDLTRSQLFRRSVAEYVARKESEPTRQMIGPETG